MAHMVQDSRYKKEMEGLDEPPFDSDFGNKVYHNVSKQSWQEWVERQKMLLNEYRLQPWTREAQEFLVEQMEQFFFGEGSALPQDYIPPAAKSKRRSEGRSCERSRGTGSLLRASILIDSLEQDPCLTVVGTWLSLVEHSLGVRGVGSSNLPVPTNSL